MDISSSLNILNIENNPEKNIERAKADRKVVKCISLVAIPIITVLGVLLSGAFSSLWFSMSSFYILPKMQNFRAFYKIIVVALPIIFTSGFVPSVLTFLFMGFIICKNPIKKLKEYKENIKFAIEDTGKKAEIQAISYYERRKVISNALILTNLMLAISTIFIILINTLTFSISSYKPMNLKRCLITIAMVNGLVALTSFLAATSISIIADLGFNFYIKVVEKEKSELDVLKEPEI